MTDIIDNKSSIENTKSDMNGKDLSDILSFLLPEIGTEINDRYKLEEEIGRGGFGIVFRGFDKVLKKTVALKFLSPKVTDNERKFLRVRREVNLSQKITDDRIVKIFSLEQYENDQSKLQFIVMEYLDGETLDSIIKNKEKFLWDEFKPMFLEILAAIKILHQNNIIHRDIKPSNIIVKDGKIKILDFGLSKEIDDREKTSSIGEIVGSPHYMSPEQITEPDIDLRSDIYQLGIILHRGLTGVLPFKSESNTMDMILKRINEDPGTLKESGIKAPKFLEFGLLKALEKNPKNRFSTIEEMENYFKKEHYPVFGKTIRIVKKKPLLSTLFILLIILSLFIYIKFSDTFTEIGKINYNGDTVNVFSKAGTKLFKKKFEGNKVTYAVKHTISKTGIEINGKNNNEEMVYVFLEPDSFINYSDFQSFKDKSTDRDLILINENKVDFKTNTFLANQQNLLSNMYYDFANTYKINSIFHSGSEINSKVHKYIIFNRSQSFGMYPSEIYIFLKNIIFPISNPGPFSIVDKNEHNEELDLILFGYNNIISHLKFLATYKLRIPDPNNFLKNNFTGKTVLKPSLDIINTSFIKSLFFIPRTSDHINSNWFEKNGSIKLSDPQNENELIEVFKNGRILRKYRGKKTEFRDNKESLNTVYDNIDRYYKHKIISKDWIKAMKNIDVALNIGIKNPWLNSALFYFKGDLFTKTNEFKKAVNALNKSLELYPGNLDAYQKKCEIEFLKGNIDNALKLTTVVDNNMSAFWGLMVVGRDLFRSYCYLQKGDFISIEDLTENIYNSATGKNAHKQVDSILRSTLGIFKGNYNEATKTANELRGKNPAPYTLIEFRLLFSRSVILNKLLTLDNSDQKIFDLAKFYIKDIAINSVSADHLAKVSRAYFLAIDGKKADAEKMAKEGFNEVLKMSKGDFFTRFWLFYESFIYGKTMEILGNTKEAVRGYKECIKANPHTDLAKRAVRSIEISRTDS